jgi:hypothetical protein
MSPILQSIANGSARGYGALLGAAGAATSYDSIATVVTPNSNTVTFSSIPSTYTHLQIRIMGRTTNSGAGGEYCRLRYNGDTGSNYADHYLKGDGSTASAGADTTQTANYIERFANATNSSSIFGVAVIDILDYANTNKYKTLRSLGAYDANGSGNIFLYSGLWMSTSAITSISLISNSGNWADYTSIALYGIKGA